MGSFFEPDSEVLHLVLWNKQSCYKPVGTEVVLYENISWARDWRV